MNRFPLSLLDLLACGFGSVILLFFVTIITWEDMEAAADSSFSIANPAGNVPFVCIVMPKEENQTWSNDSLPHWSFEKTPPDIQWDQDTTNKYTVIYMNKKLGRLKLKLENLPTDILLSCIVLEDGQQLTWDDKPESNGTLLLTRERWNSK